MAINFNLVNAKKKRGSEMIPFLDGKKAIEKEDFSIVLIKRDERSLGGWETHEMELKGKPQLLVVEKWFHNHPPYGGVRVLDIFGNILEDIKGKYLQDWGVKPQHWEIIRQCYGDKIVADCEERWSAHESSDFV